MTTHNIAGSTLWGEAARRHKRSPVPIDFATEQKNQPRIFQPFKLEDEK